MPITTVSKKSILNIVPCTWYLVQFRKDWEEGITVTIATKITIAMTVLIASTITIARIVLIAMTVWIAMTVTMAITRPCIKRLLAIQSWSTQCAPLTKGFLIQKTNVQARKVLHLWQCRHTVCRERTCLKNLHGCRQPSGRNSLVQRNMQQRPKGQ